MKISKTTIKILENFSTINQGLLFSKGKVLKTMSVMKNIFATATIPDEIPMDFAIYDLSEFLGALSIFQEPDFDFSEEKVSFSENIFKTDFFFSSPSVVIGPGDKNIKLDPSSKRASFSLSKEIFERILKNSSVMKLKDVSFNKDGVKIWNKNNVGNRQFISIPIDYEDDTISTIKVENLKLIPLDYDVIISSKGFAKFSSKSDEFKVEYFISLDANDS